MTNFFVGLDLGQAQDYTALCVVEVPTLNRAPYQSPQGKTIAPKIQYRVRHLQRFPLRTPYPEIVNAVSKIVHRLPDSRLIIDQTGVGRAVFDMFQQRDFKSIGIIIHGGDQVMQEDNSFRVPKRDLVGVLTVAFQNGELKIAESLPDAQTLVNELLNFKVNINLKTAHDSYEAWREGIHDDLVLALAVAVWYASRNKPTVRVPYFQKRGPKIPTLGWGPAPTLEDVLSHWGTK